MSLKLLARSILVLTLLIAIAPSCSVETASDAPSSTANELASGDPWCSADEAATEAATVALAAWYVDRKPAGPWKKLFRCCRKAAGVALCVLEVGIALDCGDVLDDCLSDALAQYESCLDTWPDPKACEDAYDARVDICVADYWQCFVWGED